ncbi:uncharacterized protein LOC120843392 [Ixodes scapularis]|uniref:uncharacterized protein LOC120843392 n=1 Tax=Ixodes scapularis TaxID=6945 RepID=UPI001A9F905B|nr:uncharacterized protein LOC120843392 [Ixodes scapularis]
MMHVIGLLKATNATLHFHHYATLQDLVIKGLADGSIDVFLHKEIYTYYFLRLFDFPRVLMYEYPTFYANANATRLLSPGDVFAHSSTAIVLFFLSLCFCLLILCFIDRTEFGTLRNVSDTGLFLFATLYATSSVIPYTRRRTGLRRSVYAIWLLSILPLSTYFRGQMTSWLSTNVPENVLDTLEELRQGLDSGTVAPCVVNKTPLHHILRDTSIKSNAIKTFQLNVTYSPLMKQLMTAFRQGQEENLVASSFEDCVLCARRNDRVCFTNEAKLCTIKPVSLDVSVFKEHYNHYMTTTPVRKNFHLKEAFRNFLGTVRESSLLHNRSHFRCEYEAGQVQDPPGVRFELWGFFQYYAAILSATVIVLLLELIVSL